MDTMASQITSLTIVYSTVYSRADQRKYQSSASQAFVRAINREPVNSPHKWPVTRKMFPFHDVVMTTDELMYRYPFHFQPVIGYGNSHGLLTQCISVLPPYVCVRKLTGTIYPNVSSAKKDVFPCYEGFLIKESVSWINCHGSSCSVLIPSNYQQHMS